MMDPKTILLEIEQECKDKVSKNKVKINRFASKYENAKQCFTSDEENGDLYDLIYDLSIEFDLLENDVYFYFVESKYTNDGQLKTNFEQDFAEYITLQETINN